MVLGVARHDGGGGGVDPDRGLRAGSDLEREVEQPVGQRVAARRRAVRLGIDSADVDQVGAHRSGERDVRTVPRRQRRHVVLLGIRGAVIVSVTAVRPGVLDGFADPVVVAG